MSDKKIPELILPRNARPKPFSEVGDVYATHLGWVSKHPNGSEELLVECRNLDIIMVEQGFDVHGTYTGETPVAPVETPTAQEQANTTVMTRSSLMEMDFHKLKALAVENEVTEKSREKIVAELCDLFGLGE